MRSVRPQNSPVWTTRWRTTNHGTVCWGIRQLMWTTTLIFQNLKKRRRNTAQNEGVWKTGDPMEDWEQSQLSAINFHFLHQLWCCFSQAKHKSATLEPYNWKKTQNIYLLHSEKITSPLGSYTGKVNDNLQWSRTPWVTATILFWGGRGIKLQQM